MPLGEVLDAVGGRLFGYALKLSPAEDVPVGQLYTAPVFLGENIEHPSRPRDMLNHAQRAVFVLPVGVHHLPRLLDGLVLPEVCRFFLNL